MKNAGRGNNRRLITMGLAGLNLLAVSGILLLPGAAGASQEETVFLSVLVVSVQAGQSVVVQVGQPFPNKRHVTTLISLGLLLASAMYESTSSPGPALAIPAGLAIAGVLFGTFVGALAQGELAKGNASSYQLVLITRSFVWAGVLALVLFLTNLGVLYASLIAWAVIAILSIGRAPHGKATLPLTFTILLGAAAGLLYRNDVSLARAAAFGATFPAWNIALVAYTISQALLGFVVVNEIFSRREAVLLALTPRRSRMARRIVFISLPLLASACVAAELTLGSSALSIGLQTVILITAGSIVATQASLAHIVSASRVVYLAGAIGFGALVTAYAFDVAPGLGLLAELCVSGAIVAIGTLRTEHRSNRHSPPSPQS
jgi:hypothetical protein